jgi:signal transduction histidine kinase
LTGVGIERTVFSVVLAATQLAIAFYVYIHSRYRPVGISFAALGTSLAIWTIAIAFAHAPDGSNLFVVRLAFASATTLVMSLLTFVSIFPASPLPRTGPYIFFMAAGSVFAAVSFTGLVVTSSQYTGNGLSVVYGVLHPAYGVHVVAGIAASFLVIRTKLNRASGRRSLQLRYLLLALLVPAAGIAITNLLVPLLFGISSWGRYGPAFTLVFLGVTAHAIMRQRLMDIRLVVGRTVAYAAAVLLSGAVFVAILWSIAQVFPRISDLPFAIQLGAAFALAVLFGPLTRSLTATLDRYCYREPYDYSATVRHVSLALSSTLDLQQLLKNLLAVINGSIRPEFIAAYLWNEELRQLRLVSHNDDRGAVTELPSYVDASSPLVTALAYNRRLLFRDEAEERAHTAMQQLGSVRADCACPIFHEDQLLAVMLLGAKLSGDAYFSTDIDLLATVSSQAAVALKNAELYQRVTQLEAQRRRAERVAESGALTAGIAHEIKNPLVAIRTFAELLPERYTDQEFREQFGNVMIREIARIDKLIDRLRGLAPSQEKHLSLVELTIPLEETLSLLSAKLQQSGIRVRKAYPAKPPIVRGSIDDLKQLFLNLLMNACESMQEPGEIVVRMYLREALGVLSVVVEIEDEGPGISDDIRERLFHPFISTKHGSSGLGLWLSRRIADAHNAIVRGVNRQDRRGAIFSVEFPVRPYA